ncbi:MAG: excinuclease ABC subunit A, partial [Bacteriovoracaceae bacterium]
MSKAKFNKISIEGARTNNLKNINLDIPLNKITCIYGPSGSGKSSLAFGTLVDESKRRFINSLPNDIKFLWNIPPSADVDLIEPVLPVWSLSQINPVVGSRPVVGDLLGATELLSRVFYLFGEKRCSICHGEIVKSSLKESIGKWIEKQEDDVVIHFLVQKNVYEAIAPIALPVRGARSEKGVIKEFEEDFEFWEVNRTKKKSYLKGIKKLEEFLGAHKPLIVVKAGKSKSAFKYKGSGSQCLNCETTFDIGDFRTENFNPLLATGACSECDGFGQKLEYDLSKIVKNETLTLEEGAIPILTYKQFSHLLEDYKKDLKLKKIDPDQSFSRMPKAKWDLLENGGKYFCGLQEIYSYLERMKYKRSIRILSRRLKTESQCEACHGSRLANNKITLLVNEVPFREVLGGKVRDILVLIKNYKVATDLSFNKLIFTLEVACELGLGNLRLSRKVKSLSSGEYQRLLLVKILAQQGTGMLFVLDEPSRGLSYEEQKKLMEKINILKEQGNTIALVDHSEFVQKGSDFLVKMGPGAGNLGGQVESILKNTRKSLRVPKINEIKLNSKTYIEVIKGKVLEREFENIRIPMNAVTWVLGDSGSGKSLFFKYLLYNDLELKHTGVKLFDLSYSYRKFHSTNVVKKVNYFDP